MVNEEQPAILRQVQVSRGTMQYPHSEVLYPYKFVMSRILTH
jgi:hypothetical protein